MRLWRHLTLRGRVLPICGILLTVASLGLGQRDMAWVGLLLILLPVLGLLLVTSTRLRMSCVREVEPSQCPLGETMAVRTTLNRGQGMPIGVLRFEETVPRVLGLRPRFSVHTLARRWRRSIDYTLTGRARGRYTVGPMLVRVCDPFGTAVSDHQFAATNQVMVTPRVWPLQHLGKVAGTGRSGETIPQQIGTQGQDDVLIREYRQGDDLRRVHWRSSAHQGDLMVRREEQSWDPAATVLLDSRAERHSGLGAQGSFEWSVSAAASVCSHLLRSGYQVRLADASGPVMTSAEVDLGAALERSLTTLTDQRIGKEEDLVAAARACTGRQAGETVVAILGRLSQADVLPLDVARTGHTQALALVLDTDSFTARRFRGTPEQADEHDQVVDQLRGQGWSVVTVHHGDTVPAAWQGFEQIGASR